MATYFVLVLDSWIMTLGMVTKIENGYEFNGQSSLRYYLHVLDAYEDQSRRLIDAILKLKAQ